jgi:hypothetical protein
MGISNMSRTDQCKLLQTSGNSSTTIEDDPARVLALRLSGPKLKSSTFWAFAKSDSVLLTLHPIN